MPSSTKKWWVWYSLVLKNVARVMRLACMLWVCLSFSLMIMLLPFLLEQTVVRIIWDNASGGLGLWESAIGWILRRLFQRRRRLSILNPIASILRRQHYRQVFLAKVESLCTAKDRVQCVTLQRPAATDFHNCFKSMEDLLLMAPLFITHHQTSIIHLTCHSHLLPV